jgi:hypothetical protein
MNNELLKEHILRQLKQPDWEGFLNKELLGSRVDILWLFADWVKEGQFIEEAMRVAEIYATDPNPEPDYDHLNEKIAKGGDIRNIYTVRGTVPWLLQKIIATLKTEYYPRALSVIEQLTDDESLYVREQVPAALSSLTVNVQAKQNKDGTLFNFEDADKARAISLAWKLLRKNEEFPRVLEHVINVFDRLRNTLTEAEAKEFLTILFYDSKGELRPDYLTEHAAPYVFFFAEYRSEFDKDFKGEWFRNFLKKLIQDSNLEIPQAPRLKTTLIWITWKQLEGENKESYELFKKYIPLFFEGKFHDEPVGQFEFLAENVLRIAPQEGVQLYKQMLEYLKGGLSHLKNDRRIWLSGTQEIIETIAKTSPGNLPEVLAEIEKLLYLGAYVGEVQKIFSVYQLAPENQRSALKTLATDMYERIKQRYPDNFYPNLL